MVNVDELPEVIGDWHRRSKDGNSWLSYAHNGLVASVCKDHISYGSYIPVGVSLGGEPVETNEDVINALLNYKWPPIRNKKNENN